jgi:LacI family transcriptional regulator
MQIIDTATSLVTDEDRLPSWEAIKPRSGHFIPQSSYPASGVNTARATVPQVLVMIESSRESGRQFLAGVADYARHFGPWIFHWRVGGLPDLQKMHGSTQFDGAILRDVVDRQALNIAGVPTVVMECLQSGTTEPSLVVATTDNEAIGRAAASHLLSLQLRQFAFCGYGDVLWSEQRGDAFVQALGEMSHPVARHQEPRVTSLGERFGSGNSEKLRSWLESLPKPVGLFAANDDLAEQIVNICRDLNIRMPDECAIIGVDNDPVVCGMCNPSLTSIGLHFHQTGYKAAEALAGMMSGCQSGSQTIQSTITNLVERQSTNITAADDPIIAKALRFIRDHARRQVDANEIALASGLSRRGLEQRFRQRLGRSIMDHYREERASCMARALLETNLSITDIAEQFGFTESAHFTRFFRSVRSQTPSAFRTKAGGVKSASS